MAPRREDEDRDEPPADEAALSARLQRLGERLGQQQPARFSENRQGATSDTSGLARGLQLTAEFAAGILVGAAIGWLMDRWLGTRPWGMMVWLMLGFGAGIRNLMRAGARPPNNAEGPPGAKT